MEMKSLNKPDRSDSMLTMSTLRRNSQDSKSIDDNLPPYRSDMDRIRPGEVTPLIRPGEATPLIRPDFRSTDSKLLN
jgi:hypothetical protein